MKKEDIEFRKKCQLYHNKIKILLRSGKIKEAQVVIDDIQKLLIMWEDYVKSARFKVNILKSLFTKTILEQRNFKWRQ